MYQKRKLFAKHFRKRCCNGNKIDDTDPHHDEEDQAPLSKTRNFNIGLTDCSYKCEDDELSNRNDHVEIALKILDDRILLSRERLASLRLCGRLFSGRRPHGRQVSRYHEGFSQQHWNDSINLSAPVRCQSLALFASLLNFAMFWNLEREGFCVGAITSHLLLTVYSVTSYSICL